MTIINVLLFPSSAFFLCITELYHLFNLICSILRHGLTLSPKIAQTQPFCLTFMNAKITGIHNYPQYNLFSKLA